MVDVQVEFDYEAEQPDELSIRIGDIIKNVSMVDGGWWEGELNGKKGMFPDNFVKVIKEPKKDEGKKKDVQATKRQSVKDLANKLKLGQDGPPPMLRKKNPQETGSKKKRAKVTFSYEPENEDELKLEVGEMIDVTKQEEEGWWEGILNGRQGMFPSNFVEIVDDTITEETSDNKMENTEEHMIKGKKIHGVGLGNIFGQGPIKLRKTGDHAADKKPQPGDGPKAGKREDLGKPKEVKPVERAKVRYSYVAENEDELSLDEGDIIVILDKELEDSGWWKGELNGRVGVFPDNFVEIIEEEHRNKRSSMHVPIPVSNPPMPGSHPADKPSVTPAPQPKPKKPPPPTQPAVPRPALPKLPDKAPVVEHTKSEEKSGPPVIQSKKPVHPPPPITKKPVKPVDTVSKEEKKEDSKHEGHGFEAVENTSDKLTHLTASRARGPQKRPPSQVLFQNPKTNILVEENTQDDEWNGDIAAGPAHVMAPSKQDKTDDASHKVGGKAHPPPSRPAEPSAATASLQHAIDELRKELNELRTNTVSKSAFNELKAESEQLKQDMESFKGSSSRRMRELMAEVDEEKKIRLSTQVEMERIRKIVAESHV